MGELPDGTFFRMGGSTYLSLQGVAVEWSQGGYIGAVIAPETASIQLLTPPSIINLYSTGWQPAVNDVALVLMTQAVGSPG
jgi:hypothetical protein